MKLDPYFDAEQRAAVFPAYISAGPGFVGRVEYVFREGEVIGTQSASKTEPYSFKVAVDGLPLPVSGRMACLESDNEYVIGCMPPDDRESAEEYGIEESYVMMLEYADGSKGCLIVYGAGPEYFTVVHDENAYDFVDFVEGKPRDVRKIVHLASLKP